MSPFASETASGTASRVSDLVAAASRRLREAGSPSPRLDAELLVADAVGGDRAWLLAHPEAELGGERRAALERSLRRRLAGEPVAYIRGHQEWLSLRLAVDRRAIVPRPETELLAEAASVEIGGRLADGGSVTAWDVGTGSGALGVALGVRFRAALERRAVRLIASDISPPALELAGENLAAHGIGGLVELLVADLLAPAGDLYPRPDVVVANLPYVARGALGAASLTTRFEPREALDGGADGLAIIRRLVDELPAALAPGGVALIEVGAGQAPAVVELAAAGSVRFTSSTLPDLAGFDRVVRLAVARPATAVAR